MALNALVRAIGGCLSYLNMSESYVSGYGTMFQAILSRCVNLEHPVLSHTEFREDRNMDDLLEALSGDLGQRLVSLDVDGSDFDEEALEKFVDFLTTKLLRTLALRDPTAQVPQTH